VWIYTQSNIKNITSLYCSSISSLEGEIGVLAEKSCVGRC
jgi:hypothetical protein